jgi:intraflagellar transport protein 80
MFAQLTNRTVSYAHWHCRLNANHQMTVHNILAPDFDSFYATLEFAKSVIAFALGFDYLVVATTKQCLVYQIVPLAPKSVIFAILQTPSFFVLVSSVSGLHIVGYDGRTICQIQSKTLSPHLLNAHNACAANVCAVVDVRNPKRIHLFDPYTARALTEPIEHSSAVSQIALNVAITSSVHGRKVAFIDANKDLFLTKVHQQSSTQRVFKLKTIVDSVAWHPDADILLALSDKQLVIWYYLDIVWCDTELIEASMLKLDTADIGQNARILSVEGSIVHFANRMAMRKCSPSRRWSSQCTTRSATESGKRRCACAVSAKPTRCGVRPRGSPSTTDRSRWRYRD